MRALEKQANDWARAAGHDLPSERDTGRLLGDSYVTTEQLRVLEQKRENAQEMREYLTMLEERLRAIDHQKHANAAERKRIAAQIEILQMRYQGDGVDESGIAHAFGKRSHSWASEKLAEIKAEAKAKFRHVGSVAVMCARPTCPSIVMRMGRGRPAVFCSERCRAAEEQRRRRARRAARRGERMGKSAVAGAEQVSGRNFSQRASVSSANERAPVAVGESVGESRETQAGRGLAMPSTPAA